MNSPLLVNVPINADNEGIILANVINNYNVNKKLFARRCKAVDFRFPEYQAIAYALLECIERDYTPTFDTLITRIQASPHRYNINAEFIEKLCQTYQTMTSSTLEMHIDTLHLDSVKHAVMKAASESLYAACLDPRADMSYIRERVNYLNTIIEKGYSGATCEFKGMDELIPEFQEMKVKDIGFRTTGFKLLDGYCSEGYKEGKITVVGGLPGMGKSSFTLSSMKNLANLRIPTAQFALEMDSMSIITKLAAFNSDIAVKRITKQYKDIKGLEKKHLDYTLDLLKHNRYIKLNDKPSQSLDSIREQIMILQDNLQTDYLVVAIDLFGKITDFTKSANFANDYEKKLNKTQAMFRALKVHGILVAQINRNAVNRTNKLSRPRMSDFKNSGAFEEVADLILGVHRPFYDPEKAMKYKAAYGNDSPIDEMMTEDGQDANLAEILILKQRMGAANDIIRCYFDPDTTKFTPLREDEFAMMNLRKQARYEAIEEED